jgi:protein CWC15
LENTSKRQIEDGSGADAEDDTEAKRRRILEETRDIDADSDGGDDDTSSEEDRYNSMH